MYFPESATIANRVPDLAEVIESLDRQLSSVFSTSPLRPRDFASLLGLDLNQVDAVFELLTEERLLELCSMLECGHCSTLIPPEWLDEAIDEEMSLNCSMCGKEIPVDFESSTIYRMVSRVAARIRPSTFSGQETFDHDKNCENIFRKVSDQYELRYAGQTRSLRKSVGLHYLRYLIIEQGRAVSAVELNAMRNHVPTEMMSGSSGETADLQAIRDYRVRFEELSSDLESAQADNDLARAGQLEQELNDIASAIIGATGLGGRVRVQSDTERVRKSVSKAVSEAIEKISDAHQQLGRHLEISVQKGMYLKYAPEEPVSWTLT
ncbi:hypothetical protein KOR42_49350 [Thalassoglobus neptunius]|uniref:Uncharacterized protein n=1 Tax=Thalassoglobus neptunius TaxID=1938619 RepID=A0A5C5VQ76_9PLAN|nr:hypothetical protein [Thalassoglobus neptunius]TWT40193.1 hypothetical protein KOR42_49350 [Thalassoglobus neptunius]